MRHVPPSADERERREFLRLVAEGVRPAAALVLAQEAGVRGYWRARDRGAPAPSDSARAGWADYSRGYRARRGLTAGGRRP